MRVGTENRRGWFESELGRAQVEVRLRSLQEVFTCLELLLVTCDEQAQTESSRDLYRTLREQVKQALSRQDELFHRLEEAERAIALHRYLSKGDMMAFQAKLEEIEERSRRFDRQRLAYFRAAQRARRPLGMRMLAARQQAMYHRKTIRPLAWKAENQAIQWEWGEGLTDPDRGWWLVDLEPFRRVRRIKVLPHQPALRGWEVVTAVGEDD
jgi:hypothetical protein